MGAKNYDLTTGEPIGPRVPIAWVGAHFAANDDSSEAAGAPKQHRHWSVEVPDSNGDLQSRFEIEIWDRATGTFGKDRTNVRFGRSVVIVGADLDGRFVIGGAGEVPRILEFASSASGNDSARRWQVQQTSTAESGSNAGSDFRITRFSDSGSFMDAVLMIKRSTGAVGIGPYATTDTPTGRLDINSPGGMPGLLVRHSQTTSTANPGAQIQLGLETNRALEVRKTTDTVARLLVDGNGKHEWGPGGGAGRDVNLYRGGADNLTTDDDFEVATVGKGVILRSPDGARYRLTVANGGALSAVAA